MHNRAQGWDESIFSLPWLAGCCRASLSPPQAICFPNPSLQKKMQKQVGGWKEEEEEAGLGISSPLPFVAMAKSLKSRLCRGGSWE